MVGRPPSCLSGHPGTGAHSHARNNIGVNCSIAMSDRKPREDCQPATRALSEHLNHSARRLRQAETRAEWEAVLADCIRPFAARTAVFALPNPALSQAPAFANAIESPDTVITL